MPSYIYPNLAFVSIRSVRRTVMWSNKFIEADKRVIDPSNFGRFDMRMINRGKCMLCGKELTEGLLFCKECEAKAGR